MKLLIALTAISHGLNAQNINLNNSTDYIRIQKSGESDFSRAFGINSSNNMYIGSVEKTIGNIYFFNKGVNHLMTIKPNGNVGIGTTNPVAKLQLHINGNERAFRIKNDINNAQFNFWTTEVNNNKQLRIDEDTNGNNIATFYQNGNVGIGTISPDMKLTVKGNIHAEEVKIDLNVPAPDYVFKEDYQLRSLEELEKFIKDNNHLPEIPSAKDFEQNGIMQAKMDMNLLKKIEELTLYTIQQQKEIERLKSMEKRLEEIEKLLESKK